MKKKIIIALLITIIVVAIFIFGYFIIRDMIRANSFFVVDSIHATQPAGFGSGVGERYYFSKDNTYYWNVSDYDVTNTVVATSGTWKLKDGKLVLTELYNLCLENGRLDTVVIPNGDEVEGLVDYEIVLKKTENQIEKNLEYVGLSEYTQELINEKEVVQMCYEYTMDGETWFSNARLDEMPWVDILKEKIETEK